MQISKIKTIAKTGENTWKDKTLTKWFVIFEDEAQGTLTTGFNDDPIPVLGDELEFEIIDKGYGAEVQLKKKAGGFSGFKAKTWTTEQVAQQDALKITCSFIEVGKLTVDDYEAFFNACKSAMILSINASGDDSKLPF